MTSQEPVVVGQEEWLNAQRKHLQAEKEFTQQREAMAEARRALPWQVISEDYVFAGLDGPITLTELFGDHRQLIIQHFMFGSDWDEGCPSCSFWVDGINGTTVHLAARDTAFALVSTAAPTILDAYRQRMGWELRWVSSADSTFNADMGVSPAVDGTTHYNFDTAPNEAAELPAISVFNRLDDGTVALSYQTFARGLDKANVVYQLLDLTPQGRAETDGPMTWLRRNDQYG